MSNKNELLDNAFQIYQLEAGSTWGHWESGSPFGDWQNRYASFELLMVKFEFVAFTSTPRYITEMRLVLPDDNLHLSVKRTDSETDYDDFVTEYFSNPLEQFIVHDHRLCIEALVKNVA